MRTFTDSLIQCLATAEFDTKVVLPEGVSLEPGVEFIRIPSWVASSSHVSSLRPILWLIYSSLFFPVKRTTRILSTTHHVLPFRKNQIVTVHDVRPLHVPDSLSQFIYFKYLLPRSLKSCEGILTVSHATKRELINTYHLPSDKIYVVPNAIRICNRGTTEPLNGESAKQPFLLMVGASWRHKNAMELIRECYLWKDQYHLKIVAGPGQYLDLLQRKAVELNVNESIEFISEMDDLELRRLYADCAALVYPSMIEGFGIPPLEAMAYRKPVIASDIPVFRELYGEAPIYVELGNHGSWEQAFNELQSVATNENHWRRNLGEQLAAGHSIEHMRTALLAALKEIWKC